MAPKKQKGEKMSVGAFLQDENLGSWADEMEDMPLPPSSRTGYGGGNRTDYGSSTGGMGSGGGYAHLGNMSFDATQGDVSDFFHDCDVASVRIVEDKIERKPKGFGYVEFNTLDGLKKALTLNGTNMGGRNIRISVADPPKSDRQDTRDYGDWSRKGPLPDLPGSQRRVSERPAFQGRSFDNPGAPGRSFDNMSDAGSERGSRRPFEQAQGDGKIRDFSNWERKGPLSPSTTAPTSLRDGGRQNSRGIAGDPALRRNSPAWGEGTGQSQDGSRPPRRDFSERPVVERAPLPSELDNKWRSNMRPDPPANSPTPETSAPSSPAPSAAVAAPTTRPKLNLAKRTVSEADPASPAPSTDSKASPFGAARPVDTLAREKEIEEKLRQKKEAEDKAREEKAEQKRLAKEKGDADRAKATAEKTKAVETEGAEQATWAPEGTTEAKENGAEAGEKPAAPKFEVLRRATSGDNDMVAEDDEEEADPTAVEDKAVKPKEVARDTRAPKTNGAWRNNNGNKRDVAPKAAAPAPESTTATMEEDGWSTVTSAKKTNTKANNRRGGGNAPTRAIAS